MTFIRLLHDLLCDLLNTLIRGMLPLDWWLLTYWVIDIHHVSSANFLCIIFHLPNSYININNGKSEIKGGWTNKIYKLNFSPNHQQWKQCSIFFIVDRFIKSHNPFFTAAITEAQGTIFLCIYVPVDFLYVSPRGCSGEGFIFYLWWQRHSFQGNIIS